VARRNMAGDNGIDGLRIGVYVCHCGSNIAGVIDTEDVAEYASLLPGVVRSTDTLYACADSGQNLIKQDIKDYDLNRVVVAACSVRMHEPTFRAAVAEAGLNPFLMEMANIREQCTWAHGHDPEGALAKAKDLTAAAVAKASFLTPLEMIKVPVTKRALVIGGGVAGISASLDLGDQGVETILVEKQPTIGGAMAQLNKTFPTMDCSI
jgi:heterodisulfide reductase subunit A